MSYDATLGAEGWTVKPIPGAAAGAVSTLRGPLRTIGLGDSNCFGYGNTPWSSFYEATVALSGKKLIGVRNSGIAGETSAQIIERLVRDCAAYLPELVLAQIGTNDARNASVVLPALTNLCTAFLGNVPNGTLVVCSTYPATNANATALATSIQALVASFGTSRIRFADTCTALADPATGFLRSEFSMGGGDTVHINHLGGLACASVILPVVADLTANVQPLRAPIVSTGSTKYPIRNGTFPSALTGFDVDVSGVSSRLASDPGIVGSAIRATFAAGNQGNLRFNAPSGFDISAFRGRRVFVSGKLRIQSSATSFNCQLSQSDPINALNGVNVGGSFQTMQACGGLNDANWFDFYYEYDVPQAAVFSSGDKRIATVTSVVGGTVTVDAAECFFGIVPISGRLSDLGSLIVSQNATSNQQVGLQQQWTVDATSQAINFSLPLVANAPGPITFVRKDATANVVTITANGAELINGASSYVLPATQYKVVTLVPMLGAWYVQQGA